MIPSFDSFIFSDASFDSVSGAGVGAILLESLDLPIQTKVFRPKTIARLELLTALWALETFERECKPLLPVSIVLITDCKAIADLPQRRVQLEARGFKSKRTSLPLVNADLYREFYGAYDRLHPTVSWIRGHSPTGKRSELQEIFTRVDRAARQALRKYRTENHRKI